MGGTLARQRSVAVGGGSEWHWNKDERDGMVQKPAPSVACAVQASRSESMVNTNHLGKRAKVLQQTVTA
ncbi:hypothetical protein CSHISOI_02801, partial [Colletotrichum shisoi]